MRKDFLLFVGYVLSCVLFAAILSPVGYLLWSGDFPGATLFYGLNEDHWFVTALLAMSQWIHGLLGYV